MKIEPVSTAIASVVASFFIAAGPSSAAAVPCPATTAIAGAASGTISNTVRDATTGLPVVGAIVEWSFGQHDMTGSTDDNGGFAFKLPIADQQNGEQVKLTITHNSYKQKTASVTACPGTNPPLALELTPIRQLPTIGGLGAVAGQVLNQATGLGIPGATIAILIGRFPAVGRTATTGSDGKYEIRNVGYASGLTLEVTTDAPPCVAPARRPLDVNQPVVTENFVLPVLRNGQLRCPKAVANQGPRPNTTAGPANNPSLADSGIQWEPATTSGLLADETNNIWNSGHINDILKIGPNQVLIAGETSGVWSVTWSGNSAAAFPLSANNWDSVIMTSLAQGPDGAGHVYAGTTTIGSGNVVGPPGVLWESDTSQADPLVSPWARHSTPCNNINHVLVLSEVRRIVLACDNGLYWSSIPSAPAARGIYNWLPAQPAPGTLLPGNYARLAKGPGWGSPTAPPTEGTIAVIAWGGTAPGQLVDWGGWSNGNLVLNAASVPLGPGRLFQSFGRGDLAACPLDPHTMYAMASTGGPTGSDDLAAVWKSTDGGQSWTFITSPPHGAPPNSTGHQGDWNQALAVSQDQHANCNTFALGWSYSSFVSFDGGNSYPMALSGAASGCGASGACNLHDDYHALLFDPGRSAYALAWQRRWAGLGERHLPKGDADVRELLQRAPVGSAILSHIAEFPRVEPGRGAIAGQCGRLERVAGPADAGPRGGRRWRLYRICRGRGCLQHRRAARQHRDFGLEQPW